MAYCYHLKTPIYTTPTRYTPYLGPPQRRLKPPSEKVLTAIYILLGTYDLPKVQLTYETVKKELSKINPEIKFLKFYFDDKSPPHAICYFNMGDFYFFMNRGAGQQEDCRMLCYKTRNGIFQNMNGAMAIYTKGAKSVSDQMKDHIKSLFRLGEFIETEEDLCSADPMRKDVIRLLNLTFKPQKYGNCMAANFFSLLKVLEASRGPTKRFSYIRAEIKRKKFEWIMKSLSKPFFTPECMAQSIDNFIVKLQEKSDQKRSEGDRAGVENLTQTIRILERNLAQTNPMQSLGECERAESPVHVSAFE